MTDLPTDLKTRLTTRLPLGAPLQQLERDLIGRFDGPAWVVQLVTRLFDADLSPDWVGRLWPSVSLVVLTTASGLGAAPGARRALSRHLRRLRPLIPAVAGPSAPSPLFRVRHPFASFHQVGWQRVRRRQPTPYCVIAAVVHIRVRALEGGMLENGARFGSKLGNRRWDYLKTARMLCVYGPALPMFSSRLRRELVDACGQDC